MLKSAIYTYLFHHHYSLSKKKKIKIWEGTSITKKQKWSELFIFLPQKQETSGVSIIICPGGSYFWLDMDNEGFSIAEYFNKQGITAFVLKYRTALQGNHYPAMIQDLENAIQYVKTNSKNYGIDPNKVGVMGFSAGGHLAGMASIYSDISLKPCFTAMIYPFISMEKGICHYKSAKNLLGDNSPSELIQKMSLEKNVHANMPPIFLLHCTGDQTVNYKNSMVFAQALTKHNVKHKFLLIDENGHGGHGFGIKPNGKATGWIEELLKFIEEFNI